MTFQLDTSGHFCRLNGPLDNGNPADTILTWDDLSPFAQGYIEALFASAATMKTYDGRIGAKTAKVRNLAFSDLAPETLARIIADCEAIMAAKPALYDQIYDGKMMWKNRQAGFGGGFEPLTVQLGDDGKVRFA